MPQQYNNIYVVHSSTSNEFLMNKTRMHEYKTTTNRHQARFFRRLADAESYARDLNCLAKTYQTTPARKGGWFSEHPPPKVYDFQVRRISFRVL